MRAGPLALTLGATAVALGGVYLLWELRTGGGPAPTSVAATDTARPRSGSPDRGAAEARPAEARPVAARPAPTAPKRGPLPDAVAPSDPAPAPPTLAPVESAERLLEANKLYDRGDYENARQLAIQLLAEAPGNVKLLRVVVSSACILGDPEMAQKYVTELPPLDRSQMADRCAKFQIALK